MLQKPPCLHGGFAGQGSILSGLASEVALTRLAVRHLFKARSNRTQLPGDTTIAGAQAATVLGTDECSQSAAAAQLGPLRLPDTQAAATCTLAA